jgi:hypothetical protein
MGSEETAEKAKAVKKTIKKAARALKVDVIDKTSGNDPKKPLRIHIVTTDAIEKGENYTDIYIRHLDKQSVIDLCTLLLNRNDLKITGIWVDVDGPGAGGWDSVY